MTTIQNNRHILRISAKLLQPVAQFPVPDIVDALRPAVIRHGRFIEAVRFQTTVIARSGAVAAEMIYKGWGRALLTAAGPRSRVSDQVMVECLLDC